MYNLGYNIGPEIGIMGALGYIYTNVLLGIDLTYAQTSESQSNLTEFQYPVIANAGYTLGLNENLHLTTNIGSKSLSNNYIQKILAKTDPDYYVPKSESFYSEITFTLTLTYRIPELHKSATKAAKSLVMK